MAGSTTELLKTLSNEYLKRFIVRDGQSRTSEVYEARVDAADGDTCLKTTYVYFVGEAVVQKMKEEPANWSAVYDI